VWSTILRHRGEWERNGGGGSGLVAGGHGRTDLGLMSSGQVAGLIEAIVREAETGPDTIATFRSE
jgi:hypothetical protein